MNKKKINISVCLDTPSSVTDISTVTVVISSFTLSGLLSTRSLLSTHGHPGARAAASVGMAM